MIISTMRQHHRVRVGLPNPRHRIGTDRPDGRYVGSFDGNDEKNCPGADVERAGGRLCRDWLGWPSLSDRCGRGISSVGGSSGTGPTSRQLQEKVGGVAPAGLFSLGDSRNWRCIGFRIREPGAGIADVCFTPARAGYSRSTARVGGTEGKGHPDGPVARPAGAGSRLRPKLFSNCLAQTFGDPTALWCSRGH
jgi:hypothetical protein